MLAAGVGFASINLALINLASVTPAHAQAVPSGENPDTAAAECPAADADADTKDCDTRTADAKDPELDWSLLNVDASTLTAGPAAKARQASPTGPGSDMSWSSSGRPNGSAAVSVKQSVSPFWDTRIGADMTVARQSSILTASELLSEKLANGGSQPQSSGTAWAAITAPGIGSIWDKTSLEARVDPAQEQSKLGTSLSKSLPLNEQYSLTLRNGYNLIQQGVVPVPGIPGHPVRNLETDQSAKLSITDTGTSLIAGQTLSSADDKWLRKVGAEQKLFDGVNISGSIGETATGAANKSVTAGFKRSW
jgi:hypothetical protein